MTLIEKIDTSVTPVMSRTTAKAPITAMPPTRVGISADTRLPKISRLSRKTIGSEIDSARAMSLETCSLTSPKTAQRPPTLVLRPGADRSSFTASQLSLLASWVAPASVTMTRVAWLSVLTSPGDWVAYQVTVPATSLAGRASSVSVTAFWKAGSCTVRVGLE